MLNENKTKFMVINGTVADHRPIIVKGTKIENCDNYVYLGSIFTEDGTIQSSIKQHCKMKASLLLKYQASIQKKLRLPILGKKDRSGCCIANVYIFWK